MKFAEPISVPASHATVLARISCGSQSDLAIFFDATSQLVFALIVRIVGDQAAAAKVLLEVYWQVWKQAECYDSGHERPLTWLLRIARKEALDYLQTNGRILTPLAVPVTRTVTVGAVNAVGEYAQQQRVRSALGTLPAEQLQAIEMAYFGGLSQHEIAAELHCSPDLIRQRIGTAMKGLQANVMECSP